MGLIVVPGAPAESSITVHTRSGTPVLNAQFHDITQQQITADQRYRAKYGGPGVIFRTPGPTGTYNCNGMTFASRRTQIWSPPEVLKILTEDRHTEIARADLLPGDTVVYFGPQADPVHSGIVVSVSPAPVSMPIVCSKWGNCSEVIHPLYTCPYIEDGGSIKFYRVMV